MSEAVRVITATRQGKVYQKDLGLDTESIVRKMKDYDPDPSWTVSAD